MQNTLENKQKFFALYMFQNVLRHGQYLHKVTTTWNWAHEAFTLELKSLSDISDEDAVEVAFMYYSERFREDFKLKKAYKNSAGFLLEISYSGGDKTLNLYYKNLNPVQYDYLRSRGYLLPFNSLTIEQILSYQWAKVK
jgi:hypothetical protein